MRATEPTLVGPSSTLFEYVTGEISETARKRWPSFLWSAAAKRSAWPRLFPARKRRFTAADLPLFGELARRASLAIDNAALYQESQQAVRAREEVLAIVSHDLRNPLNAVTLGASLLETSLRSHPTTGSRSTPSRSPLDG